MTYVPAPEHDPYAPKQYQLPEDPGLEAVTRGAEAYAALRSAYGSLEEHHQNTVVNLKAKEKEIEQLTLVLAMARNGEASAVAEKNEALRERDRVVDLIHSILALVGKYDFNPLPAPMRRKNGKNKEVEIRQDDPVSVLPEEGGEVQQVRDVPSA